MWHTWVVDFIRLVNPCIIFGFPPCTDLAISGAIHFASKLAKDPLCQWNAVQLAKRVEYIANLVGCRWMAENPKSVLSTQWRKRDHTFSPWEYGGWLPVNDVHPRWPEYIAPRDAYPKETWIWCGNGFVMPPRLPVPMPEGYSTQFKKLGGKSAKTKQIRSETPRGYAIAVLIANYLLKPIDCHRVPWHKVITEPEIDR